MVEVFALVREVAARVLGLRACDEQIMGALTMQQGKLIGMRTGEGKILVAVFPAVLHALSGPGTRGDRLSRRQASHDRQDHMAAEDFGEEVAAFLDSPFHGVAGLF